MPRKPAVKKTAPAPQTTSVPAVRNPYSAADDVKASATFQLFRDYWLSQDNLDDEGFDRLLNKFGYSTTWVYIAVKRIADAVAQIPWQIVKRGPDNKDQVVKNYDRGLLQLLTKPNPYQSWFDFMEALITSLELTGNVFVELVNDNRGRPSEMYVLNPARVTIVPDKRDYIAGYVYSVNGRSVAFDPEEIIHIKYHHPNNDYYGMSPLTAARVAIEVDKSSNEWNQNFLLKGSWPAGALETENDLGDDEVKRLQRQIKQTMQVGKDQAGRVLLLTGGMKYNKLGLTPKDTDWMDGRRMSRDEILACFGVPYAVAGLFSTEQTTARSAGVELQIKQFYRTTIFSKVDKIFSAFNRELIPRFREAVYMVPNYRSIPALQEEVDQELTRAQALKELVSAGLSLNKALARLYPDVESEPWGDVAWMNKNVIPIDGPELPETQEDPATDFPADQAEDQSSSGKGTDGATASAAKLFPMNTDAWARIQARQIASVDRKLLQ